MAKRAVDTVRLKRLYNRLKRASVKPQPSPPGEPVDEMMLALLVDQTTERRAETSLRRLKRAFVDYNEIRVTRLSEIEESISPLPDAAGKARAISLMLNAVFDRHHKIDLVPVFELSKRDARKFLEKISTPAAAARVLLMTQATHAIPVDDAVHRVLLDERITEESVEIPRLQTSLERHLKSGEAYAFYRLVRDYADTSPPRPAPVKKAKAKPKKKKKATGKAVAKKTSAKEKKPTKRKATVVTKKKKKKTTPKRKKN